MTKPKKIAVVCNYALNPNRIGGMDCFYVAYDQKTKELGFTIDWYFLEYQPFDFYSGLTIFSTTNHFLRLCSSFFKKVKVFGSK